MTQQDWDRLIHPDDLAANHEADLRHARGETESHEHAFRIRMRQVMLKLLPHAIKYNHAGGQVDLFIAPALPSKDSRPCRYGCAIPAWAPASARA